MSDSMLVFVEGSKLPKVEELRNEVKAMGLDLEAWELDEKELSGRDYGIELAFHSELDVEATVICIVALCKLSDAISFNEDE